MLDIVRHALRRLARAPGFAVAAILTLMLGIGGTSAVFTLVNGVLLRPLPYHDPEQLVDLSHTLVISGIAHIDQSDATYLLYRSDNRVFADIGAYRTTAVNLGALTGARASDAAAERVSATFATAGVFNVLGVSPDRGRRFTDDDTRPGAPAIVVIGHRLWEERFGGDRAILGRHITINGAPHEIVGVMPATFAFPTSLSELWLPLVIDPAHIKSAAFDYRAIARLRPGASLTSADADLQRILPHVPEAFPGRLTIAGIKQIHMQPLVRAQRDVVVGDVGRILWIVLGGVSALLLIACANVANLFLARAEGRQRELVVRRALGAGRGALLADFVAEAAVLAAIGGALGLAAAAAGIHILQTVAMGGGTTIPRLAEVGIDAVVFAATIATTALAALFVSAAPVARLDSASLSAALIARGGSATSGRTRQRARRSLVVAQVALALILLVGAGLFARSFARLRSIDPGFRADHALAWRVSLPSLAYPTTADAASVVVRAIDAVGALPGVRAIGAATRLPLDAEARQDSAVFVEDHPLPMSGIPNIHEIVFATPGYFAAMGIPLVAGRLFERPDPAGQPAHGPPEVIVNAAFAERYWKGQQAVGKRVRMNPTDPWHIVVGVVGSVRDVALDQPPGEVVYAPLVTTTAAGKPWSPHDIAFVARTAGDPTSLGVRGAIAALDPALPLYRVMPVTALQSEATARTTFTLFLLGVAAVVATAIGAFGIYGVISYLVSLRTREIGLRIALGAQRADVRRLITGQALTDALVGVGIGLVGTIVVTRALGALLYAVSPTDPTTLAAAALLLVGTAGGASWLPAQRAAALDPARALREE